jgi:lysophospholipase L1-like esterase
MLRTVTVLLLACLAGLNAAGQMKFDFGAGKTPSGFIKVVPAAAYSDEKGYGYEPSEKTGPVYFTVKVPEEGNYRVTVTLGDEKSETTTTIKAELRRLMLARIHTAPGKFETRSFIVNIRNPKIAGGGPGSGEVRLKDREKTSEAAAWDNKLQLEFTDTHPGVRSLSIEKDDKIPTIFIAGDSTSTDQPREPFSSWGQSLPVFFKPEVAIANHGESGESLRGFFSEKRVDKILSVIRPGDFLLIQMGHNDQKDKGEGVGAFTTYKSDLKRFTELAKGKGATVVLISPMARLSFGPDGKLVNTLGDYPEAVRQAAKEENVALIDLNAMSQPFYEALGPADAHKAFAGKDTTHHDDYGSYELAKCIVQGIKDDNLSIAKFLYPLPVFDPAHPDPVDKFDIPAEPTPAAVQRPLGN